MPTGSYNCLRVRDEETSIYNIYVSGILVSSDTNPFNPLTRIEYSIPKCSELEITVYNLVGQRVQVLFSGKQEVGTHRVEFDGTDLPSGICLYQIKSGNFMAYKKCVLLK